MYIFFDLILILLVPSITVTSGMVSPSAGSGWVGGEGMKMRRFYDIIEVWLGSSIG